MRATLSRLPLPLLAATFAALLVWSLRKWTDAQIDYGNELYIAWQLSEGRSLYADIAHRHGPLSHYVNAALFAVFGASLRTLVVANLAVLAAICAMTYRILVPACGRLAATVSCLFFLVVFGFSQYAPIGNFNYVTPYQHAQTHGLALALAMVLLLARAHRTRSRTALALAGLCLGATFLGKAEIFAPAAATAAAGLLPTLRGDGARGAAAFGLGAIALPLLALVGLAVAMPLGEATVGVLGNWAHLGSGLSGDAFYLRGAGLDAPARGVVNIAATSLLLALAIGVVTVADTALAGLRDTRWAAAGLGLATCAVLVLIADWGTWRAAALVLPATSVAIAAALIVPPLRAHLPATCRERGYALALFAVLATALLGKIVLAPRVIQYGFVLGMPAAVLLVAALVGALPAALAERRGGGRVAAAVFLGVVAAAAFGHLAEAQRVYAGKTVPIGSGADAILADVGADRRGPVLAQTLAVLEERIGAGESLLVLPEGVMLNYWLRRTNPTRFTLFLPPEQAAFGADAMVASVAAHPPDWIVLLHRGHEEFGVGPFGRDARNGRALLEWVRGAYRRVERIGAEPFVGDAFGAVILQRRAAP